MSEWLGKQLGRAFSLFGIFAGLALIPVYAFYFLLEKRGIEDNWTSYLPLRDSHLKNELAFALRAVNDQLIAFFRGQVLGPLQQSALQLSVNAGKQLLAALGERQLPPEWRPQAQQLLEALVVPDEVVRGDGAVALTMWLIALGVGLVSAGAA
mgnify:CR=1 FL=1